MPIVRRAALALLVAAALAPLAPSAARAFPIEAFDAAAFAAAEASGKPVVLHVHATWCPICRVQGAQLITLSEDPRFDDFVAFRIDHDAQPEAMAAVGADSHMTLIVRKAGEERGRLVADRSREAIEALLATGL